MHRNTAILFYHRLRRVIAEELTKASPLSGEVEVDESYFVGRRGKANVVAELPAKSQFSAF